MVGVLALQGAFLEHRQMLDMLKIPSFEIRQLSDLEKPMDGLILPGGESTVQGKLLRELSLFQPIQEKIKNGLPVFGTCAGMILLSKELENSEATHFATMDITVIRNAYGRQAGSFQTVASFGDMGEIPMSFIRAPYIKSTGKDVETLATVDGNIVAARSGTQLVTSFHPEVTNSTKVHEYFTKMLKK